VREREERWCDGGKKYYFICILLVVKRERWGYGGERDEADELEVEHLGRFLASAYRSRDMG
jgi:hypothetical protein